MRMAGAHFQDVGDLGDIGLDQVRQFQIFEKEFQKFFTTVIFYKLYI